MRMWLKMKQIALFSSLDQWESSNIVVIQTINQWQYDVSIRVKRTKDGIGSVMTGKQKLHIWFTMGRARDQRAGFTPSTCTGTFKAFPVMLSWHSNHTVWAGAISYDGCTRSLPTGAHVLCLPAPTKQVKRNIMWHYDWVQPTGCRCGYLYFNSVYILYIRLSTGAMYSVLLLSGAWWTLHWNGGCIEPVRENRRWFVKCF